MSDHLSFVTTFDSNYLTRGLALYYSLCDTCKDFMLFVVAMDDEAYQILDEMNLSKMTLISMREFEDDRLLAVKPTRTKQEYAWTCSSFSILYAITHFPVDHMTYLDADLYFFSDPNNLMNEMKDAGKDVLITRHNYAPEYDQSDRSGIYCVQYLTFMNNQKGLEVLNWWVDRVEEWCYARVEDGKMGDQKYLDDWPERFDCVSVSGNIGAGIAPWNMIAHSYQDGPKADGVDIIFCHFHAVKWLSYHKFDLAVYKITKQAEDLLFQPYCLMLQKMNDKVSKLIGRRYEKGYFHRNKGIYDTLRWIKNSITRRIDGTYNVRIY